MTAMPALTRLAEDEVIFRDSVYEFADREVRPLAREMDEHAKMSPALIEKLFELGVMGIEVPESYGGAGGTFFHSVLAVESLSRVDPSVGVLVDVQNTLVINAVMRWGTDEHQAQVPAEARVEDDRRLLPVRSRLGQRRVRAGDARHRTAATASRSPAASCGSPTATKRTSSSSSPTSIPTPATAASPRSSSIAARPGFTVGKKEDKLGIRASSTCELLFEDCVVPKSQILGEVGKGYKVAIETLNEGRIGIGAQMLGLAQGALDHTVAYMKERKQFGKAIGEFQGVQFQIARMAIDVEAARLLVYNCARLRDAGLPFLHGSGDVQGRTRRKLPSASRRWRSICTAATAS